jgi:hypothetical protein
VQRGFPGLAAFMVDRPMVGATVDSRRAGEQLLDRVHSIAG